MKYYIEETVFDETRNKNAGSKARQDINVIAEKNGFIPVEVQYDHKLRNEKGFWKALIKLTRDWTEALNKFVQDDIVLIQFPINHHPLRIASKLRKMRKKGAKVIVLIHDVDSLRMKDSTIEQRLKHLKVKIEDKSILGQADAIIAHNHRMIEALKGMGLDEAKMVSLEIFDYIVKDEITVKQRIIDDPVVIAGTLRKEKAEYVYHLPTNIEFNLYGVGYEGEDKDAIKYMGSFMPEELPNIMEGCFGVVWDGDSSESCLGISGEYLKINNPHKTSLYLSSGLPVISWDKAAISDYILKNKLGVVVSSLYEIKEKVQTITSDEYSQMVSNAVKISERLRTGYYASLAISEALAKIS